MKSRLVFFSILFLIALIDIVGCRRAGTWLVKDDGPVHADAMVLLMGVIPDRVLQAGDLYNAGISDRLIIVIESTGPYKTLLARGASFVRSTQQANDAAVALGIPSDCITIIPGDARSTLDEAKAVRDYLADNPGADTLLLVSSAHHMRRASIIFRTVLRYPDKKVHVICSPSAYTTFDSEYWWKTKEDIQHVISELVKIVAFQVVDRWGIEELSVK